ncbi:hypothetical protein [Flavobacterium sp.]|uniref:hypothetical protein n=1 Tax=Flavobacterium sp. TaxID=239 RepID=UPI0039E588C9
MIENRLHIILSLRAFHTYFEDGNCNCLSFQPTAKTKELFQRFGLVVRKQANGFDLYTAKDDFNAYAKYIQNTTGQTHFEFEIHNRDTHFRALTELPLDQIELLYYDTAMGTNNTDGKCLLRPDFRPQTAENVLGRLRIGFSDLARLSDDTNRCTFEIRFEARATQWQYYIINHSAMPMENPAVKGKSGVSFGQAATVVMPNGESALLFSSGETLLALSEVPQQTFDLVNQFKRNNASGKNTSAKILIKGLPHPKPSRLVVVDFNGVQHASSPMYVYV